MWSFLVCSVMDSGHFCQCGTVSRGGVYVLPADSANIGNDAAATRKESNIYYGVKKGEGLL